MELREVTVAILKDYLFLVCEYQRINRILLTNDMYIYVYKCVVYLRHNPSRDDFRFC